MRVGKYVLVIDLSAKLKGARRCTGPVLYQAGFSTVKQAKDLLKSMRLNFVAGTVNSIYCATIGKWIPKEQKYHKIERTGNGVTWYKNFENSYYDPSQIVHIRDWTDLDEFQVPVVSEEGVLAKMGNEEAYFKDALTDVVNIIRSGEMSVYTYLTEVFAGQADFFARLYCFAEYFLGEWDFVDRKESVSLMADLGRARCSLVLDRVVS